MRSGSGEVWVGEEWVWLMAEPENRDGSRKESKTREAQDLIWGKTEG